MNYNVYQQECKSFLRDQIFVAIKWSHDFKQDIRTKDINKHKTNMQIDKKKTLFMSVHNMFYFISFKVPINQATTNHQLIYHIF